MEHNANHIQLCCHLVVGYRVLLADQVPLAAVGLEIFNYVQRVIAKEFYHRLDELTDQNY